MKTVILAGGFGTRISEESHLIPKPMVAIGGYPILWHIMKIYSSHGFDEFVICLGYKGIAIKEYFDHYFLNRSDVTFTFSGLEKRIEYHNTVAEPWMVTLSHTGRHSMTGGRVKRIQKYIGGDTFMLTYGDGVSDVPIDEVLKFHKAHGKMVTMTSVIPSGRFGVLDIGEGGRVMTFSEKPRNDANWINGGFFVCEAGIFDHIPGDETNFEYDVLPKIARMGELMAYRHEGFWGCMDTVRDRDVLNRLWESGQAPWKRWGDNE